MKTNLAILALLFMSSFSASAQENQHSMSTTTGTPIDIASLSAGWDS